MGQWDSGTVDSGQWARWESAKLSWLRNVLQSGVPWGQSSGLWAHCRFHLMSVKLWTVHIGQWAHCRGHSRQRAWPRFRARRVTAIAKPPIPVIIIATRGALPIIAWAMAPVAAVTPMPVTVPAHMAPPNPLPAVAVAFCHRNPDGSNGASSGG